MRGFLKFTALATVATDPEFSFLTNGTARMNLRCVVNTQKKQDDKWVDEATWLTVTVWGKRAEGLQKNLKKGAIVALQGNVRENKWEDKETKKTRTTYRFLPDPMDGLTVVTFEARQRDDAPKNGGGRAKGRPEDFNPDEYEDGGDSYSAPSVNASEISDEDCPI